MLCIVHILLFIFLGKADGPQSVHIAVNPGCLCMEHMIGGFSTPWDETERQVTEIIFELEYSKLYFVTLISNYLWRCLNLSKKNKRRSDYFSYYGTTCSVLGGGG